MTQGKRFGLSTAQKSEARLRRTLELLKKSNSFAVSICVPFAKVSDDEGEWLVEGAAATVKAIMKEYQKRKARPTLVPSVGGQAN